MIRSQRARLPRAMSSPIGGPDGLNHMLVLGLLAERPGSGYELDQRLQQRFMSAELARGTARHAIKKLLKEELVRLAPSQRATRGQIYEPTEKGLAELGEWVRAKVQIPPIREELIGKVGVCQPTGVSDLMKVTRDAQQDLMTLLDTLNRRVRERRNKLDPRSWATRMDLMVSCADHAAINGRVCFAQQLHRHLVEELSQADGGGSPSAERRIA
jgi:DNA-binding PadR family transcriptional regulator